MVPSFATSTMEEKEAISIGAYLGARRKPFPEATSQASLRDSLARGGSHV